MTQLKKEARDLDYTHTLQQQDFNPATDTIIFKPVRRTVVPVLFVKDGKFLTPSDIDFKSIHFPLAVTAIDREGKTDGTRHVLLEKEYSIDLDHYRSDLFFRHLQKKSECLVDLSRIELGKNAKTDQIRKKCLTTPDGQLMACSGEPRFTAKGANIWEDFLYAAGDAKFSPLDSANLKAVALSHTIEDCGDCPSQVQFAEGIQLKSDLNKNGYAETWISDVHNRRLQIWENFEGKVRALLHESSEADFSSDLRLVPAPECGCEYKNEDGSCRGAW